MGKERKKMSCLFVHNIRIKEDELGNLYTHSSYNKTVWHRYKTISNNLSIIARREDKLYDRQFAYNRFEKFDKDNMKIIYVEDIYKSLITFLNPINHYKNNHIIKNAVKEHDYIIARLPSYSGYKAVGYAIRYNKPYIIEVVACPWDGLWNHSIKGKIMAPFSFIKMKRIVRNSPYVIYVTNEFLQKRYPTKGKNTNCSNVALIEFNDKILEQRIKKINAMHRKSKIIIGTTAAVNVRYKGQQYVIKALGKLKKEGITNFEYQLVGDGDQTYLKKVANKYNVSEQVKFLGSMSHIEVFKWLDTIDLYVQPSRQEGLPRALIEAMSRGLPAFGARTGGIPELLEAKFIFSNTKKNIDEICCILRSFDKKNMLEQAKRNFEEAKKYDKQVIEERRKNFFREFIYNT